MNSRERVMAALNFQPTDRVPMDLGGMRSTGISAFAYPRLVEALGLPPRRPKIHDTGQMLAIPDLDVLDALHCDVVTVDGGVSNAFEEPGRWHNYDFGGRLQAQVLQPQDFEKREDGVIVQCGRMIMPAESNVFNEEHSGQPMLDFNGDLPLLDLKKVKKDLEGWVLTPDIIQNVADRARRARESSDRAVFFTERCGANIGIGGYCGLGIYPVICKLEPDFVAEYHTLMVDKAISQMQQLLPELKGNVDILLATADDWGTQKSLIASPETYRKLFLPFYKKFNDEVHRLLPGVKIFMHNCGAIYSLLDLLVESGFDIINPIQWPAGGHGYAEWKEKLQGRAAMWGGGVDAQHTLQLGTLEEVEKQVADVVSCCSRGGGYVFNNIHNLLAETDPQKIIAMYRTAYNTPPAA